MGGNEIVDDDVVSANHVLDDALPESAPTRNRDDCAKGDFAFVEVQIEVAEAQPGVDPREQFGARRAHRLGSLDLKLPAQECSVHQFVCSPVLSGIAVCLLKLIANLAILSWPATSTSNEHHTDPLTTPTRRRNF